MRIDLVLQRFHARLQQKSLLLFQLDLDAHVVKYLQLDSDRHERGRINATTHPQKFAVLSMLKMIDGKPVTEFGLYEAQAHHDQGKTCICQSIYVRPRHHCVIQR